jgi:hypothetical protein
VVPLVKSAMRTGDWTDDSKMSSCTKVGNDGPRYQVGPVSRIGKDCGSHLLVQQSFTGWFGNLRDCGIWGSYSGCGLRSRHDGVS